MNVYFEYKDFRGIRSGWSDDFTFKGMADAEKRAYSLIGSPRFRHISTVVMHRADNDEAIIEWSI